MPEWSTPELFPVWWNASCGSFSITTTPAPGNFSVTASAVASPMIPPPITATSYIPPKRTVMTARVAGAHR